jgi:hypothetical protein
MMRPVPFANMEGQSDVKPNSQESLLNMYADVETSGYSRVVRVQRPGLDRELSRIGEGRGIWKFGTAHYYVFGTTLFLYENGVETVLGPLTVGGDGPVSMAWNGDQVAVCDGKGLFVYDGETLDAVPKIDDLDYTSVDYLDGFGIVTTSSPRFYVTALNDFKEIDSLDFASSEGSPDDLIRVYVDHREIWLFGTTSIEVWYSSGGTDFPFSRMNNASIERGLAAASAVASEDNTVFWLAEDGIVYRADGYRPVRISVLEVEAAIQDAGADIKTADAWFYNWKGHKFFVLTVPGRFSYAFDAKTGLWHKAETYRENHWIARGNQRGKSDFVMGRQEGLFSLSDSSSDDNSIMIRGGTAPPVYASGSFIRMSSYRLDIETGLAGQSQTPKIMLQLSRDGKVWGNEKWRTCGKIGEYRHRAVWRNMGAHRLVHLRLRFSDDAPLKIVGAEGRFSEHKVLNG